MAEYDPIDTLHWMLAGVRDCMRCETVPGANGKPKKKTKAQATEDRIRFETICEALWNVEGRPGELEAFIDRHAHA